MRAAVAEAASKQPKLPASTVEFPTPSQPRSHRLFGTYMNSIATYQDANTAWLSSDSMLSWVTSSVYERFAGGGYLSGFKLIRGYSDVAKSKDKDRDKDREKEKQEIVTIPPISQELALDEMQQKSLKRKSAPPYARASSDEQRSNSSFPVKKESQRAQLQRQLSSLIDNDVKTAPELEEHEILDDYNIQAGETQGREIEHLILVTHGIGQLLGLRKDSLNFVHDVNILRKTIKGVYSSSADLKALNSELGAGPGNCRIQVLPVCWRHLLDFPRKQMSKGEYDLADTNSEEEECKLSKSLPHQSSVSLTLLHRSITGRYHDRRDCICSITDI